MAQLIGGLGTSHVPSIGVALDRGQDQNEDWKPFFDGYDYAKDWVKDKAPDIAIVVFNDHGNSIFLDRVPTFAIGVAPEYAPADEGWGPRNIPNFDGAEDFSWYLADKAGREPLRSDDHPRDRSGSRMPGPHGTFLWPPEGQMAGQDCPDYHQYCAVPDPNPAKMLGHGHLAQKAYRGLPH